MPNNQPDVPGIPEDLRELYKIAIEHIAAPRRKSCSTKLIS